MSINKVVASMDASTHHEMATKTRSTAVTGRHYRFRPYAVPLTLVLTTLALPAYATDYFNLKVNDEPSTQIFHLETVSFDDGSNIAVTRDKNDITIATRPDLKAHSLMIKNGPTLNAHGIDAGGDTITHVADGAVDQDSSDAVNGSQLFDTNKSVHELKKNRTHYYSVNDGDTQQDNFNNDGATGKNSLAAGPGTTTHADESVAIGHNATIPKNGIGNVAIGGDANGDGTGAKATGPHSTAVGSDALAHSDWATAIGHGSTAGYKGTAVGAKSSAGRKASAFGKLASASGDKSVSIGFNAEAGNKNSVALGSHSATAAPVGTSGVTIRGTDYAFAGTNPVGTVSVGSAGNERTITNVAAGRLSPDSTDAVNGSQLDATNQALGDVSTVANQGFNLQTNGDDPTQVAPGDTVSFNDGDNIAISREGAAVTVATTPDLTADTLTIANGPSLSSDGIDAGGDTITNVADGTVSENSSDAVNGSQLFDLDQSIGNLEDGQVHYYSVNDGGTQQDNFNNDGAAGDNSLAAGVAASTADDAENSVAIGFNASAGDADSVALGSNAITAAPVGTAGTTISGTRYAFAGANPVGTVSVGSPGNERTITNVAAGRLSPDSTDAVNGSQLDATNQAVTAIDGRVTNVEGDVTNLDNRVTNVEGDVENVSDDLGDLDDLAVKYDTNDDGSVDYGQITLEGNGDGSTLITNLAPGEVSLDSLDAINGGQLARVQNQVTNIQEGGSKYFQANSEADGADPQGAESVAIGPESVAAGDRSIAAGDGARAESDAGVALGADSVASREGLDGQREAFSNTRVNSTHGAVSVGSEGNERQITNVAGGTQATDATNVRQLQAVQRGSVNYDRNDDGSVDFSSVTLGEDGTPTRVRNVAPGVDDTDAVNVGQIKGLSNRFDRELGDLSREIDDVEDEANAGSASAIAIASLPKAYLAGKTFTAVGAGTYNGESALSVGVSRVSDNHRVVVDLNASADSQGNVGAGAGAGFYW